MDKPSVKAFRIQTGIKLSSLVYASAAEVEKKLLENIYILRKWTFKDI